MKKYIKHIAIISFLAIAQIGAFTLKAHAQLVAKSDTWIKAWTDTSDIRPSVAASKGTGITKAIGELLADETTIYYLKNDAKIECDNQEVFYKLFTSYYQLITRFSATWKVDKKGKPYKHYVIYLDKEDANIVKNWAKSNL